MKDIRDTSSEHQIYQLFKISIILKGLISLAEVILGTLLLIIPAQIIIELAQDFAVMAHNAGSYSSLLNRVATELDKFTGATVLFLAFYLLSRGLIKVGLVAALLKNKLWAYPASLGVLGLFVIYQTYKIIRAHSIFVVFLTLFDLVVMYFIWREFNVVRAKKNAPLPTVR